jgi:hypothetical protein
MSYFREIWFHCTEQSKVFKAVFVLCLYATHSFIFDNNIKMIQRGQPALHLRDTLFYIRIADTLWSRSVQERHSSRYVSERHSLQDIYSITLSFLGLLSGRCSVLDIHRKDTLFQVRIRDMLWYMYVTGRHSFRKMIGLHSIIKMYVRDSMCESGPRCLPSRLPLLAVCANTFG